MAKYLKQVEAEQYTGDLKAIKKFLNIKNAEYDEETRTLLIPEVISKKNGVRWTAKPGDYVVKTEDGFIVYKPTRFEKEFKLLEDVKSEGNTTQSTAETVTSEEETTTVAAEEVTEVADANASTGDEVVADENNDNTVKNSSE